MHHFGYTIFIALTNNVDNITARVAYSIRGIRISIPINIYISVITFVISALAAYSGTTISDFLSKRTTSVMSMILFCGIGLLMMLEQYIKYDKDQKNDNTHEVEQQKAAGIIQVTFNPEKADMDGSLHIDFKEATVLGIALSINNIGGGLSAGMME